MKMNRQKCAKERKGHKNEGKEKRNKQKRLLLDFFVKYIFKPFDTNGFFKEAILNLQMSVCPTCWHKRKAEYIFHLSTYEDQTLQGTRAQEGWRGRIELHQECQQAGRNTRHLL
jgi:hypothetical protein